jgi:hypothetical protein
VSVRTVCTERLETAADRLTVVGPAGTTVARVPSGATVADGRVAMTKLPDGDDPFVVFAPRGTPLPDAAGIAAVVVATWGCVPRNVLPFLLVPGLVVGTGLWAAGRATRRFVAPADGRANAGGALLGGSVGGD